MKLAKVEKLRPPSYASVKEDLLDNLKQFGVMSIPIFVIICFTAAFLEWLGVLQKFGNLLSPVMSLFNLPGDAAMAVVLGSVRKDGIAVGLLDSDWSGMKVAIESPAQVLTAVYLAGVLLPCIVTLFTIAREMQWKFAIRLCARQMAWASGFSILIAWLAPVFFANDYKKKLILIKVSASYSNSIISLTYLGEYGSDESCKKSNTRPSFVLT